MKNYSLAQQYALIGLDGLDSLHPTVAKKAAVRGIAAAKLLEEILIDSEPGAEEFQAALKAGILNVKDLNKKESAALEKETAALLEADGTLEEIPDLLACDMNYYTSGVDIKMYRTDADTYNGIVESVRAEILEDGPVTLECVCLLWLFRECGCLHELFSNDERDLIRDKMVTFSLENRIYQILWEAEFHSGLEMGVKSFLQKKNELFKKNQYMQGVALAFPILERRQSVFVDFVIFNTSVSDRRMAMMEFLCSKGHYVEEVRNGTETLLKIDNAYYRVVPDTVICAHVPIQGARLSPVYR